MIAPASGRRLALITPVRPLDRERALRTVRAARRHVDGGRYSKVAIEERAKRFAHLKRTYD